MTRRMPAPSSRSSRQRVVRPCDRLVADVQHAVDVQQDAEAAGLRGAHARTVDQKNNPPSALPAWCTRSNSGCGTMPKKSVAAPASTATNTTSGWRPAAPRLVELRRAAGERRQPLAAGDGAPPAAAARRLRRLRAGRLAHPHRRDHRQVVAERDHRADHDHDAEPGVAARDGRVDQIELADEARPSPGCRRARASRSSSARPAAGARARARRPRGSSRRGRFRARARRSRRTRPCS